MQGYLSGTSEREVDKRVHASMYGVCSAQTLYLLVKHLRCYHHLAHNTHNLAKVFTQQAQVLCVYQVVCRDVMCLPYETQS